MPPQKSKIAKTSQAVAPGRDILLVLMISFLIYLPVLRADFINFDDPKYVAENSHVRQGLDSTSIKWAFTTFEASNWHPVTWTSHMLDVQLFGLNPAAHHFTNLLLHSLNSVLLFWVLFQLTRLQWPSLGVALLFAVHPLNVESVAWISERKNVLSTFFWFLTILAYLKYLRSPRWTSYLLMIVCFVIGLMTKPMVVTLPCVLLLLDFWPLNRWKAKDSIAGNEPEKAERKQEQKNPGQVNATGAVFNARAVALLILEKIPLFLLSAICSFITVKAQTIGGSVGTIEKFSIPARIFNAAIAYVSYPLKMIWPANLSIFYPHPGSQVSLLTGAFCLFLLAGISFLVFKFRRRLPFLIVGWLWYLGTLLPVSGLVQVGEQSMADRYAYIPLIGIFLMISWSGNFLIHKFPGVKLPVVGFSALALLIFCALTFQQSARWKDSITLFSHSLKVDSKNYLAHNNYATALVDLGKFDLAIHHFAKAIECKPDYAYGRNNLGALLMKQGKLEAAIQQFEKAIEARPDYAEAYSNWGSTLMEKGDLQNAIRLLEKSIQVRPRYAEGFYNLALAYSKAGETGQAMTNNLRAIQLNPEYADAHNNLAGLYLQQGSVDLALKHLDKSISIKPNSASAYGNKGVALARLGRFEEAVAAFDQGVKLAPGNPAFHFHKAQALENWNKPREAMAEYAQVLKLDPNHQEARNRVQVLSSR